MKVVVIFTPCTATNGCAIRLDVVKIDHPTADGEQPQPAAENSYQNACGEYLTKLELAGLLQKTPRTIDAWMARGYLVYVKLGRTVLFHRPTIEKHLAERFTIGGRQ